MKSPSRIVTDTDRQRGWAEIEIELLDGTRQFVRVHALDQVDLLSLAKHSPADALNEAVAKALRVDKSFVERISPEYLCAASAMLVLLSSGDVAGDAIVSHAAQTVFESSKQATPSAFDDLRASFKSLREHFVDVSQLPELPKLPPELAAFLRKPA